MTSLLFSLLLAPEEGLKLPSLFSNYMVVQRNSTFKVWGTEKPGTVVTVRASWDSKPRTAKAGPDNGWSVEIPTRSAGGPYTLSVSGSRKLEFRDVLVGDVWVCSGQSNMEFTTGQTNHAAEDVPAADNKNIRLFHVTKAMSQTPLSDCVGTWQVCSPDSVKSFSAVGYFFGKEINEKTKVPIGLVDSTWGGTEAELWTSEPGLLKLPDFAAKIKDKAKALQQAELEHKQWQKLIEQKDPGYSGWTAPGYDDSGWTPTQVQPWSNIEQLKNFDGSCWFRAEFEAPADWDHKPVLLQLGAIDDDDTTWVNGVKVGETRGWNVKRAYEVPANVVKPGKNVVAVRIWDTIGEGGWGTPERQCNVSRGDNIQALTHWRFKIGSPKNDLPGEPSANVPNNSLLFNGMVNPLVNYKIKGAIWYQGEANVGRAYQYRTLFPAMINDWRRVWGSTFPFYFVQIAPFKGYGSDAAAELRDAQMEALKLEKTGVAVVTDATGNLDDIHPTDKRTPGHRLALWALARDYGLKGFEYSGPLYNKFEAEGSHARLTFTHSTGLKSVGGELREFEIAGSDKVFHPAKAKIEGDTIVVWSDEVPHPAAVRMGWNTAPQPNLFNAAGLPASPFRTDNWPGLTDGAKW